MIWKLYKVRVLGGHLLVLLDLPSQLQYGCCCSVCHPVASRAGTGESKMAEIQWPFSILCFSLMRTENLSQKSRKASLFFVFNLKILFICFQRERKGGRKRGREISVCGCLSCAPYWGLGPPPRHVPSQGIELGDPLVRSPCSIH